MFLRTLNTHILMNHVTYNLLSPSVAMTTDARLPVARLIHYGSELY